MKLRYWVISTVGLLLLSVLSALLAVSQSPVSKDDATHDTTEVVVEKVVTNSEGERAGLKEGNILLHWSREDSKGEIESPFDISVVEAEQAQRGPVTLEGLSGAEKRVWILGSSDWGLTTRPSLPPGILSLYQQGQQLASAGKLTEAAEHWRSAAQQIDSSQPGYVRIWLLLHIADTFSEARRWKEADAAYQEAIPEAEGAGPEIKAQLFRAWAKTFEQRVDWANAQKHYLEAAAESRKLSFEDLLLADALDGIGLSVLQSGDLDKAETYYSQALRIQQKLAPNSLSLAKSLNGVGSVALRREDLDKSEEYHRKALAITEQLAAGSLDVAESLLGLGLVARHRGDLDKAEKYYLQVLDIRERLAPESIDVAAVLNNLGLVAYDRDDLATAEEYYTKSLAIKQKLAPDSLDVFKTINNMGLVARELGNLGKAEEYYSQALAVSQRLAPDSLYVAGTFGNLGILNWDRGDLGKAEWYFRQGLAIEQKLAPDSLYVAATLANFGLLAYSRGDPLNAEKYLRQALALEEKKAPGSVGVAVMLDDLGQVLRDQGDLAKAEEYYRQALAIKEKKAPGTRSLASTLNSMGSLVTERGDLAKAEEYLLQALTIGEMTAPGSGTVASTLDSLGEVAVDHGDLPKAQEYYQRALAIWEKLSPGSADHAETLAALAEIKLREAQLDAAASFFEQALNALETQMARLGGGEETRYKFRARHADYYRDYIDLLVRQKQPGLALQILERSRARTFLEMLAEAHIDVRKGVDPALIERQRSLEADITAKTNRRIQLMTDEHTNEQIAAVNREIEKLLVQHKDVEEQIRASSPSYAALTQPQPFNAKQVQQLLDDDTLLLEYTLGEDRSYVFAVTPNSLNVYELPKRIEIESAARHVRELLAASNRYDSGESGVRRQARLDESDANYGRAAAALSQMVLGPAATQLQQKRLLIVGDGALLYISFAALPAPSLFSAPASGAVAPEALSSEHGTAMPLVVEHEIVNLPAASVLAVLRREAMERKPASKAVAVLADPVFAREDVRVRLGAKTQKRGGETVHGAQNKAEDKKDDGEGTSASPVEHLTRSMTDTGLQSERGGVYLPRLPFSRREAATILSVTPTGQGMEALDFQASRATAISPDLAQYRVVHFATHGLLDNEHPELSGLVFSLVDQHGKPQNGFVELQDIYNLNLSADLVVLSACETGLGKEVRGEGLVGLTRGFMYAGANRVMASLWSVDDVATAELMGRFYQAMEQQGRRPAAALRQAQVAMLKQERWSSPYYWAGFVIQGEWK